MTTSRTAPEQTVTLAGREYVFTAAPSGDILGSLWLEYEEEEGREWMAYVRKGRDGRFLNGADIRTHYYRDTRKQCAVEQAALDALCA